jgi:hypothetical protein
MLRSARPVTVVVVVPELFPGTGSPPKPLPDTAAVAVFVNTVPSAVFAGTTAVIVIVAVAPASRAPMTHERLVVPVHVPEPDGDVFVQLSMTDVSGEGRESVIVTLGA